MRTELYADAIGEINGEFITQALEYKKKNKNTARLRYIALIAACMCVLAAGIGIWNMPAEELPPHIYKIDGLYYMDAPDVDADTDIGGNSSDVNGAFIGNDSSVHFESIEEAVSRVYSNDFTDFQKQGLAMQKDENGKVQLANVKALERIPFLSESTLSTIKMHNGKINIDDVRYESFKDVYIGESQFYLYDSKETFEDARDDRFVIGKYEYSPDFVEYVDPCEYRGMQVRKRIAHGKSYMYTYMVEHKESEVYVVELYIDEANADDPVFTLISPDKPYWIEILVCNEEKGIYYMFRLNAFKEVPTLDWIKSFAEISD